MDFRGAKKRRKKRAEENDKRRRRPSAKHAPQPRTFERLIENSRSYIRLETQKQMRQQVLASARKKRTSLLLSSSRVVTVRSSVVPEGKKDNKDGKPQVKKGTTRRKAAILGVGLFGSCQSAGLLTKEPVQAVELSEEDLAITHRVYFDVGLCSTATNNEKTLGAKNIFCTEPLSLGRIELGLYGNLAKDTVQHFVEAVNLGVFNQTIVHKVLKGRYILAGKPGSRKFGEIEMPPADVISRTNQDLVSPKCFALKHVRPGTVSLFLQDEKSAYKSERLNVANLEFAITTGPGPVPYLDEESLVFGTVTSGLDVIQELANVPTFQPNENLVAFNKVAALIGDDRAGNARDSWGKPRKAILFTQAGEVVPEVEQQVQQQQDALQDQ